MIRFVALVTFKPDTPDERVMSLTDAMPEIMADFPFPWSQGLNAGFSGSSADWLFTAEFNTPEDVANWMAPSPAYLRIREIVRPHLERASVIHVEAGHAD